MITYIVLAGVAVFGVGLYFKSSGQKSYKDVTIKDLKELMKDKNTVLIDVRTPKEMKEGVIGKPLKIELGTTMQEKLKPLKKDKKYILYCRSGRRSILASRMMTNMGFKDVNNLHGGYNAWVSEK